MGGIPKSEPIMIKILKAVSRTHLIFGTEYNFYKMNITDLEDFCLKSDEISHI